MITLPKPYPFRETLALELHARPSAPVAPPVVASRIVMLARESAAAESLAHLAALCARRGAPPPAPNASYHALDLGPCVLRFERHTELSAYTVVRPVEADRPLFAETALAALPADWLESLPGELLAGVHAHLRPLMTGEEDQLRAVFGEGPFAAARIGDGAALMASDYRLHADGFERLALFCDPAASPALIGRLLQTAFEITTYRMAALMAFPVAQETRKTLNALEQDVSEVAQTLSKDQSEDRPLLDKITALAARAETLSNATSYRFAAANAYHRLVQERAEALAERPALERPTTAAFLARRLAPAMRTCAAVEARQAALLERIGRATALLATRVQVKAEEQNAALLASMDTRSRLQLRLQEAVEGLSTVAISYYALGIVSYLAKAAEHAGAPVDAQTAVGLAAVPILGGVFWFLRRLRRSMADHGAEH